MPFALTKIMPVYFSAPVGTEIEIAIQLTSTQQLAAASYNKSDLNVTNDLTTTFTVVDGDVPLSLAISGHDSLPEDLAVVEVSSDGSTQHLYGYRNDYEANINLWVKGV